MIPDRLDLLFLLFGLPIALTDLRYRRIPDILSLPLIIALGLVQLADSDTAPLALAAGFAAAPLLLRVVGGRGIGGGDLKLGAAVGLYLPGAAWIPALACATVAALVVYIPRRAAPEAVGFRIPFAPYLVAGAVAVRFIGPPAAALLGW